MSYKVYDENWLILNKTELSIKNKIEAIGVPLSDWKLRINFGIKTGLNEAFVIDESTKNKLIKEDSKSAEIIRPILRGKDIKKYSYEFKNLYLINTHNGNKSKNEKAIDVNEYPAIKGYLDKFYDKLIKRYDKGDTPYNLRNCIYMDDFYKQKIVYPCIMAQDPCFAYDNSKYFAIAPGNIISGEHLKYLCCLLNSELLYFALRKFYMGGGIEGELKTNRLLILPVKKPSLEEEKLFENLYNEVTLPDIKQEKKINDVIFSIYNLSTEEILYVKQNSKKGN